MRVEWGKLVTDVALLKIIMKALRAHAASEFGARVVTLALFGCNCDFENGESVSVAMRS